MKHSLGCVCNEIDPADRPCVVCELTACTCTRKASMTEGQLAELRAEIEKLRAELAKRDEKIVALADDIESMRVRGCV